MAEIKIRDGVKAEVNSLTKAASGVATSRSVSIAGVESLKTCVAYEECCRAYLKLVEKYKELAKKDANEIKSFITNMQKADNA